MGSVKKSVASQRKQLSNPFDRQYIQHWLADHHRDVAADRSSRQDALHQQRTVCQQTLLVQGNTSVVRSARNDIDDDQESQETNAKLLARMERFSEHLPVKSSEVVSKGGGKRHGGKRKYRGSQSADDCAAHNPVKHFKKNRWEGLNRSVCCTSCHS